MEASQLKQLMECLAYSVVISHHCKGCELAKQQPKGGLRTDNGSQVSRGQGRKTHGC